VFHVICPTLLFGVFLVFLNCATLFANFRHDHTAYITPFMNTKIDIKSALVGLGVGVLVTLGIAAAPSPGTVGRYQIAGTGNQGLVLDTTTGQVWSAFFSSSSGGTDGDFFKPKSGEKK
jgi:hypothetical protein